MGGTRRTTKGTCSIHPPPPCPPPSGEGSKPKLPRWQFPSRSAQKTPPHPRIIKGLAHSALLTISPVPIPAPCRFTNTPAPIAATRTITCKSWPTHRLPPAPNAAAPSTTKRFPLRASRSRAPVGTSPTSEMATRGKNRTTRKQPTARPYRHPAATRNQRTARPPRPIVLARPRAAPQPRHPHPPLRLPLHPPAPTNKATTRPS